MRVIAIGALVLAASILACRLAAQPNPIRDLRRSDASQRDESIVDARIARDKAQRTNSIAFEERLSELGSIFGKELNSAINEGLMDNDQAARLVQEIEMDFAVRAVRLDLLRLAHKIERLGAGVPGSPRSSEIDRLREQLKGMLETANPPVYTGDRVRPAVGVLQPQGEPTVAPQRFGPPFNQRPADDPLSDPSVAKPEN